MHGFYVNVNPSHLNRYDSGCTAIPRCITCQQLSCSFPDLKLGPVDPQRSNFDFIHMQLQAGKLIPSLPLNKLLVFHTSSSG